MVKRMWKRLTALALALVMALSLAACGGADEGTNGTKYAGDYRVSVMIVGGERQEYADLVDMGLADGAYLKLKEDGTGVIAIGDGDEMPVKINEWDGKLIFDDGTKVNFWEENASTIGVEFEEAGLTIYYTTKPAPAA